MDSVLGVLHRLAAEFGPRLAAILLMVLAVVAVTSLYILLEYGERAAKMFIPFATLVINTLGSEKGKKHPAIRVEYAMHRILILLFFGCLGVLVIHSLIPWRVHINEVLFEVLALSLAVVIVFLGGVSLRIAIRHS